MENQLSSSGIFSQDPHRLRFLERFRNCGGSTNKSRTIRGNYSIDDDVQRHWLNEDGNSLHCISNSPKSERLRKKIQRGYWSFFGPGNAENGMRCILTNLKENWTKKVIRWLSTSNKVVIPYSEVQVRPTEESWGEEEEEIRYTSQRNQQTLNFHFTQFTRQISSVSSEQCRVEVMSLLRKGAWSDIFGSGPIHFKSAMISYRNSWIRKKVVLWYKTKRGQRKHLDTCGVIIYNDSRWWILTNNVQQSVNQPES